ncbi:hypothetical protein EXIGLDRAFT_714896 [Exidia glandulosa HHB12029]|uniref:Uncharacterized protein n=1 Tax=Exidia glandulosa HHB12029 TaxID=1314781 RepID=A0A165K550_EXIGL|nr:hypothetical protein EXIGLDRAFT_714896 [Exidia glandulosa HHB12029]
MSAAVLVVELVARAVALYASSAYWSQSMHTSTLSGQAWVDELISGHPDRMKINFGMPLHVFTGLIIELRLLGVTDTKHVSLEEKLGIFLYTCVTGMSCRLVGERFQRSKDTVTCVFREILRVLSGPRFYTKFVRLPAVENPPAPYLQNNPKFWPFFDKCLGALDGTHIICSTSANMRDHKGSLSQNVFVITNFNFRFVYVLSGCFIYSDARLNDLPVPDGYYYLGNTGFPQCAQVLVPYRGVQFHLREWAAGNRKPFERIFGVLKKCWQVLVVPMNYSMELQARIPIALCALHNFMLEMDGPEAFAEELARAHDPAGKDLQNLIAEPMWVQYQDYIATHAAADELEEEPEEEPDDVGVGEDEDDNNNVEMNV